MDVPLAVAPPNAQWPFASAAIDAASARELYGQEIGDAIAGGGMVMTKTSAGLAGAQPGDVLVLVKWSGGPVNLVLTGVYDDDRLPAEILMSTQTAAAMGFVRPTNVLIYNYKNDATIDQALTAHGLRRTDVRISRGGSSPTPDSTLAWPPRRRSSASSGTSRAPTATSRSSRVGCRPTSSATCTRASPWPPGATG